MEQKLFVLRIANPTYDDGLAYARYVDAASEGGLRFALGRRFLDIIATAFLAPAHDFSYEQAAFAERDGEIVGMIAGYAAGQQTQPPDLPLRQAAGSRIRRALGMVLLGVFKRFLGHHSEGEFYIHFLAVDETSRGLGIGRALMEFMEQRARAAGCSRFTLDVSAKNTGAARLYERCGLTAEAVGEKRSFASRFVHRMAKNGKLPRVPVRPP